MEAIHVFAVIIAIAGPPISVDLLEHTYDTMQQCREYVEANPQAIADAVEEMRPHLGIPDDMPFKVAYGCRGKKETDA
jgi:hypothetical protein